MGSVRENITLLVALVGITYGGMLVTEKVFFWGVHSTERKMTFMKKLEERREKRAASQDKTLG